MLCALQSFASVRIGKFWNAVLAIVLLLSSLSAAGKSISKCALGKIFLRRYMTF